MMTTHKCYFLIYFIVISLSISVDLIRIVGCSGFLRLERFLTLAMIPQRGTVGNKTF